jgi:ferredoxin
MAFILSVSVDKCTGHGRCYSLAPGLLTDDVEGYVTLRGGAMEVPVSLLDDARRAEASCPESAITISDE